MKSVRISLVLALILALAFVSAPKADNHQSQSLTIVWAEWDPANYLQELSKDFTAETGIAVDVIQIPWPNFQDKVFHGFRREKRSLRYCHRR